MHQNKNSDCSSHSRKNTNTSFQSPEWEHTASSCGIAWPQHYGRSKIKVCCRTPKSNAICSRIHPFLPSSPSQSCMCHSPQGHPQNVSCLHATPLTCMEGLHMCSCFTQTLTVCNCTDKRTVAEHVTCMTIRSQCHGNKPELLRSPS